MTQEKKQDHSEWFPILVELRDSGIMNMWGAPRWLEEEYDLPREEASQVFFQWMDSFNETPVPNET